MSRKFLYGIALVSTIFGYSASADEPKCQAVNVRNHGAYDLHYDYQNCQGANVTEKLHTRQDKNINVNVHPDSKISLFAMGVLGRSFITSFPIKFRPTPIKIDCGKTTLHPHCDAN